jgi:hypothetical protein
MSKNSRDLFGHIIVTALVLSLWRVTSWFTDTYLLPHFPLAGMELLSFQVVKIALHLVVLRYVYRMIFPPPPSGPWWM